MKYFSLLVFYLATTVVYGKSISSSAYQVNLVELYSSQGCSSCPPAEQWLNQLKTDPRLFKQFIPINFHVDYWDYLGWKDPFARQVFTRRQQLYQHFGYSKNIATPGFVINGKGWNGWFYREALPINNQSKVGQLTADINKQTVAISFTPQNKALQQLQVHIAILAFEQKTYIKRGENKGRELNHDFIVIGYQQGQLQKQNNKLHAIISRPDISKFQSTQQAIVIWLSKGLDPVPIQAVADWL